MGFRALELRRRLLDEAVGRKFHADELSELTMRDPGAIHEPTLRVLAHSQRIRALELRGRAAALAVRSDRALERDAR